MSSIDHLHAETSCMPVKEHRKMLSKQFLLATMWSNNPNNIMRETLRTKHHQQVNPLTLNGTVVDDLQYKEGLRTIHTSSVAAVINAQQNNKVLQQPVPNISKTEASLPRKNRVTLAQLRSGYSPYLNSYLNRTNPTTYSTDSCPGCEQSPHTTQHLFSCLANPTTLSTRTLWEDPPAEANFLGLPTNIEAVLDNG